MSSILTNMSAMTAVANLNATQKSLAETQDQISSGLKVSSAKDNAAYYSIATNMRTNVGNLSAVSDSLNLGTSVVSTATAATSNITTILQSISKALVSASQPGTDLDSVQTSINALRTQLANTVGSASFNNVNLLDGSTSSNPQVKFVSGVTGLGANTTVNTLTIDTSTTNLQGAAYTSGNALIDTAAAADSKLVTATAANTTAQANLSTATTANSAAVSAFTSAVTAATSAQLLNSSSSQFAAIFGAGANLASDGTVTNIQAGSLAATLVGTDGTLVVSKAASTATQAANTASATLNYSVGATASGSLGALFGASANQASTSGTSSSVAGLAVTATAALSTANTTDTNAKAAVNANAAASTTYNGALFSISQISLTSGGANPANATSQAQISAFIKQVGAALTAVNNASETLGAASANIDLQSTYTSALSDSLTTGVGSLVDADMNAASTRLNALQTQQQLGVQALSVANQNSQLILKLFQ